MKFGKFEGAKMSRIGKKAILIPEGVTIDFRGGVLTISGPKGTLELKIHSGVELQINAKSIVVARKRDDKILKALHGTTRQLVENMVRGVTQGWTKTLELVGTGYRVSLEGNRLVLSLGFSHKVEFVAPQGITFAVAENKITVLGISKELVGQTAAKIRQLRPPDAYKGKGIRYQGELVKLKPGKTAKVGAMTGVK